MKVVIFDAAYPPPAIGGKEKQAHLLACELLRQGVKVEALSFTHSGSDIRRYNGVNITRVNKSIFSIVYFYFWLKRAKTGSDILHIHTPSRIGHAMVILGQFLGYRVVFKFPNQGMLKNISTINTFLWKYTIKTARLLVVLEKNTLYELRKKWMINSNKILFISNGVKLQAKKINKRVDGPINILFIGRLVEQKRCGDLIMACFELKKAGIHYKLDVVGSGPLSNSLKAIAKKYKLTDSIKFHGHKKNTNKYYYSSDLLVLPSEKEGMSNVLLESMAIGLPIICTNVGAAKQMIGNAYVKYLIKPYDYMDLSKNIEYLANNQDERTNYGNYLRKRCEQKYSIEAVSSKYINSYRRVLK